MDPALRKIISGMFITLDGVVEFECRPHGNGVVALRNAPTRA